MFSDNVLGKLVILFTLLYISLIWFFPYPPLTDYPGHLGAVHIMDQLIHGNERIAEYFSFDLLKTTSFSYLIVLLFAQFVSIETAGKLFLTLYIILFVYSMNYFLTIFGRKELNFFLLFTFFFIFDRTFYIGLISFTLSVPLFFIFLSSFHKNKNLIHLSIFLVVLYFFHIFTAVLFLLTIIVLNRNYLKDSKFYLSLVPLFLLIIYLFSNISFSAYSPDIEYNKLFEYILLEFVSIFSELLFLSPFGILFFIFLTAFCIFTKHEFKIDKNLFPLIMLLILLYLFTPSSIKFAKSWLNGFYPFKERFLPFLFPFLILIFPEINKRDKQIFTFVLLTFLFITFASNFYYFQEDQNNISNFLSARDLIGENCTVGIVFTPVIRKTNSIFSWPISWLNHYYTFGKDGTFSESYFTTWFNPLSMEKNHSNYYNMHINMLVDHLYLNFTEESMYNCTSPYSDFYSDYIDTILSSEDYPFFDYLLIYDDVCNAAPAFENEYYKIYEENDLIVLKKY